MKRAADAKSPAGLASSSQGFENAPYATAAVWAPDPENPPLWAPSIDGKVITMRSFFDAAPDVSKDVPILIGSVSEEGNIMTAVPSEGEWHAALVKTYSKDIASAIVTTLKANDPRKQTATLSYMRSGRPGLNVLSMRNNVVKMSGLKHELHAAPASAYYFTWQTPLFDSRPGA